MADWLDLYVEYAKNNEALEVYHWWTGVAVLGAALRRNVSFSREYYSVYPCPWVLIIGASGTRKTTAVQIGYNIVSRLDHVRLLSDRLTPEALATALSEVEEGSVDRESQGLLFAPELANFLDKRQHNDGLVQLLLRLADCPDKWVYETRGGGKVPLRNVAVTFLGATANDLLYECIPPLALKSGFLARFICVAGSGSSGVVPFPWKDPTLELEVTNLLYEMSLLRGSMEFSDKARAWYTDWYYSHKQMLSKESSSKLRAYYDRKPDHLLKIAMIVSIATAQTLNYTIDAFETALGKLEEAEKELPKLYNEIDATDSGRGQVRILEQLEKSANGMSHADLVKHNYTWFGDMAALKRAVVMLVEAGLVSVERKTGGAVTYRRKR